MLSERQRLFLTKRQRALRWWPVGAAVVGLLWLGLVAWLWVAQPLLVNPFALQQQPPATGSLLLMAAMVPLLVDLCLLLTLALVLFVAVAARNEHRYQDILQGLGVGGGASSRL